MDCKKTKDILLDYIDGTLSQEQIKKVEKHINVCQVCRPEYEKIQSMADYMKNNSQKINTSKKLNLNPNITNRKPIRRVGQIGLIAVALSLILVAGVFAKEIFNFGRYWEKESRRELSAWEELIENGIGQKLDQYAIDKDIRVKAEGVIADELNTMILLEIKDLKGNTRFIPKSTKDRTNPLGLHGDIFKTYENIPPTINYHSLYTKNDNTVKLIVKTEPLDRLEGEIQINIAKLVSMINKDKDSIVEVEGNWELSLPVKKLESKTYDIEKTIDLAGNRVYIDRITLAATATNIEYRYETYNKDKRYFIDDINFEIRVGDRSYGRSEISFSDKGHVEKFGISRGEYHAQSLYLEDPNNIDLIVSAYRYTTRGRKKYKIDWDKLPQLIEYDNKRIRVENIEYGENSTEILIKEDPAKDREYIKSNIYLKVDEVIEGEHDRIEYGFRQEYKFYGMDSEYETRDAKGKVEDLEDKYWQDDFHNYVFEQKIKLDKKEFESHEMDESKFDEYLNPGTLYIEGQSYIKYPDIKLNIKLD